MIRSSYLVFSRRLLAFLLVALTCSCGATRQGQAPASREPIPPHRSLELPGLHAYGEKSLHAGDTFQLRVSSSVPYQASIHRLGTRVDDPSSDTLLHSFEPSKARPQPIYPGSYVHVDAGLGSQEEIGELEELTLECWVRPWRLEGLQALVTQHDRSEGGGVGLFIDESGQVRFDLAGETEALVGPKLELHTWHHVVGVWYGRTQSLWLDGVEVARQRFRKTPRLPGVPLRLGAAGDGGLASFLLDADLAMPVVYRRGLTPFEIRRRELTDALIKPELSDDVLACWALDEERGDFVADSSVSGRDGRIINRGTWMIGGPGYASGEVPRHSDYDPAADPLRGHGLRLASDDLYDCNWDLSESLVIPETTKPGLHVAKIDFELDGKRHSYPVSFIVRRAPDAEAPPILVLCSSNTWLAYNATPFPKTPDPNVSWSTAGRDNSQEAAPAYSCYRGHRFGQPAHQLGLNLPWPVAGPGVLYSPPEVGYSHLLRGERFLHAWLEEQGYAFDVVADWDLDRDPEMLLDREYKVVIANGHSEYWSARAYDAVDGFLRQGGNLAVFSGNSVFWRVSYNDDYSVMECRKFDRHVGGNAATTVGELYHSDDGQRGGLIRECGRPGWNLIGLDCGGWWGTKRPSSYAVYRTANPYHFLFQTPEVVGLEFDETFGEAPDGGLPRAGGHEADIRLSTLRGYTKDIPEGASIPQNPAGMTTLARMIRPNAKSLDYFGRWVENPSGVIAEMIFWERPGGGRVFNAGTIASGWALSADPKMQALVRNVLHHFGVPRPTR